MSPGEGLNAWIDAVVMIDAPAFRCGTAARAVQSSEYRLVLKTRSNSSVGRDSKLSRFFW